MLRRMPKVRTKTTEVVTAAEVAARFQCNTRTIARMVNDGRLTPLTKLPGRTGAYLFTREHIEDVERSASSVKRFTKAAS